LRTIGAYLCILLFLFGAFTAQSLSAQGVLSPQPVDAEPKDSISLGLIPVVTYTSELGLIMGAIGTRYHLSDDVKPYRSQLLLNMVGSTGGYFAGDIIYDQVKAFDTDLRLTFELSFYQLFEDYYFGRGNDLKFDEDRWDNEHYYFKSFGNEFTIKGRYPHQAYENGAYSDWIFETGYSYMNPKTLGDTTQLAIDRPRGVPSAFNGQLGLGWVYENRDDEINPTEGNYLWMLATAAPNFVGDFGYLKTWLEARQYFSFDAGLTWTTAFRFNWKHSFGDEPFWALPEAGEGGSLRGYPFRRFIDNGAITMNAELRTWFINFESVKIKLGGVVFTDAGRVFRNLDDYKYAYSDLHITSGFGGVVSLFNPNFILRMDLGFSAEGYLFYSGIGYLF